MPLNMQQKTICRMTSMAYVASKGAVISMTRFMARELGPQGITVNAIAPGLMLVEATQYVPQARARPLPQRPRHQARTSARRHYRRRAVFTVARQWLHHWTSAAS